MVSRVAFGAVVLLVTLASTARAQIRSEVIVRGLQTPVAAMPDPTDRTIIFIVEQRGTIRVAREGVLLPDPFLDLTGEIGAGGERGLLGAALAPDYEASGRVYVNFTNRNGDTVIARFRRRADNRLVIDTGTRLDLLWPTGRRFIEQPFANHNGGHLAFGPDGYLYVGLGDGGSAGDPMNHAQNPTSLLGKMLRIDVAVPDEDVRGYRVPEDNPFVDRDPIPALGEIWSFGVRNPWRYSFDDWTRGGTGALVIADVGQNAREEINVEPRSGGGRNYGWRLREGYRPFDERTAAAYLPLTEPIHDYGREVGGSITGGTIYRGAALDPTFNGRYFFGDFISGRVFSLGLHLHPLTSEASAGDLEELTERLGGRTTLGMVSSFAVDHDGELLILNHSAGTVARIVPDLGVVPGAPELTGSLTPGEHVELTWRAGDGVPARAYVLEHLHNGEVVARETFDRQSTAVPWTEGTCLRVRAEGADGSGPPSNTVCMP